MATEPVRRKCASSPTPDGKEGWQGIALEREQIGETDEEFRADVEFMEARAEKVLEELRRLLGQFRHRSYSGLRGQEFLMTCKDGMIPTAKIAKGTVHGCGHRRDTDVIVETYRGVNPHATPPVSPPQPQPLQPQGCATHKW